MKKSLGPGTWLYPTPVFVVGTYDAAGKANVMTVAWGGICCSKPPCVAISVRKATYTYGNLMERRAFTISLPTQDQIVPADYFGVASGRDVDKFAATGLTPMASDLVDAPYVGEFPFVLECKVVHVAELGLHTLFVGEVLDVKVDEGCLDAKGRPTAELMRPVWWGPSENQYYGLGENLGRGFSLGRALETGADSRSSE
jgi:flavin reductase (DIM6/NTAB) family NADH-FMN oxidoreductase RutF